MAGNILKGIVGAIGSRLLTKLLFAGLFFGSVFFLSGGTDLLVAIGIPRSIAGTFVSLVFIAVAIVGLGAFAKYGIDW